MKGVRFKGRRKHPNLGHIVFAMEDDKMEMFNKLLVRWVCC